MLIWFTAHAQCICFSGSQSLVPSLVSQPRRESRQGLENFSGLRLLSMERGYESTDLETNTR
jgi:hypothetical protein